jgi:hypothetical protein
MARTRALGRNALIAAIIEGGFGIGWIEWGAASLTGSAWTAVRVVGAIIGLVIIARAVRLRRANSGPAEVSMFASRDYRVVVAAEVIALVAGSFALIATGWAGYQIVWVALVVGVHFVVFGRQFAARYYVLGGALIVAAIAGLVAGIAGGGAALTAPVTGLAAGVCMFVAGAQVLFAPRAVQPA